MALSAGGVTELVTERKSAKYTSLATSYIFILLAFETVSPVNCSGTFLDDLGRRMKYVTGDPREGQYLFQRLSVAVQRFNMAAFGCSFVYDDAET